jgi:hypothetical protein
MTLDKCSCSVNNRHRFVRSFQISSDNIKLCVANILPSCALSTPTAATNSFSFHSLPAAVCFMLYECISVNITYTAPCFFFYFDVEDNVANKIHMKFYTLQGGWKGV